MLCAVLGDLGSGKTLFLVYLAYKNRNIPVFANFKIDLPNVRYIEPLDLLELNINRGLVLIDEAYVWIESRMGNRYLNEFMSYIFFQSRKRGLDFVLTAQLFRTLDVRFRELCDFFLIASKGEKGFNYVYVDKSLRRKSFMLPLDFAQKKLFSIYDTYEIIMPFNLEEMKIKVMTETNKEKTNELVDKIVDEILRQYDKVTHAIVLDYLMKNDYPLDLEPIVYVRVKQKLKR